MRFFEILRRVALFSFLGVALSSLTVQAANTNPNHDSPQTQAGDCTYCHVSLHTGPALPKQAACRECHVRWNPANGSLEIVGFQQMYGLPPAEMPMHSIFSNSGAEIQIYDFAVCFSCHGDPGDYAPVATQVTPYHGSKVNGMIWSDNLEDPNDDPYAMFYYHPGRNTFNAMSYVFNNRNGSFNQKLYSGYNSFVNCAGQTAQDLGKSEANLCVPVPRYRDIKGDYWLAPVPGYELRTTIPFDNFGADPVPTFIEVPYFPEIPPPSSDSCPDLDMDGWAVCDASCDAAGLNCGDCDDTNPDVNDGRVCTAVVDPVCGVDGNTYTGTCELEQACVALDHPGPCCTGTEVEICDNTIDDDCDGLVDDLDPDCVLPVCPDLDLDGWAVCDPTCDATGLVCGDCTDGDPAINPGAFEIPYNGIDENCSGMVDDDDVDQDGYLLTMDCNDNDANINPGATDIPCDGIDQDCSGSDTVDATCIDADADGYAADVDCNDADAGINPGAVEITCDGIDQNCNGMVDDAGAACADADGDGYIADVDCNDNDAFINPGAFDIACDGVDQDCSGSDALDATCTDVDGDTYTADVDCNDNDFSINPGATDIPCDGIDQDCSGSDAVDATCQTVCADLDKTACNLDLTCEWVNKPKPGYCQDAGAIPTPEVCTDSIDNDLDGLTDCDDSDCFGIDGCATGPDCSAFGDRVTCNENVGCSWSGKLKKCLAD